MKLNPIRFYVGLDDVHFAGHFARSFISVKRLVRRKSDFPAREWIMDSGAFYDIGKHGKFLLSVGEYAEQIDRWSRCGNFQRAATQDYMCEPFILAKTGLTVRDHQRMTIERYDALRDATGSDLLPVLQGYKPWEYVQHIEDYGARLTPGMWVGVGSVCKRNTNPKAIEDVLLYIKNKRSDLRLHGFGLKITALRSPIVRELLYSADSMAWSKAARMQGRNAHDWREADAFRERIATDPENEWNPRQIPLYI